MDAYNVFITLRWKISRFLCKLAFYNGAKEIMLWAVDEKYKELLKRNRFRVLMKGKQMTKQDKEIITKQFALDIGLLPQARVEKSRQFYPRNYLFESDSERDSRLNYAELEYRRHDERLLDLPNCVDKRLQLFEFESDEILRALNSYKG